MTQLTFTPETKKALQVEYDKAVESGLFSFTFEGVELNTVYAKYLLWDINLL